MNDADDQFEELLAYLKQARGFDFTGYKRASLLRRVHRRMLDVGIADVGDYMVHLELHPGELSSLFDRILINVTGFLRDPDAWEHLRTQVLPDLLRRRPSGALRFWSAGCASGQEPYSLAMLLLEALGEEQLRSRVKIYATDVDDSALSYARQASFSGLEVAGLPTAMVERHFETVGERHVLRNDVRRAVIFGRNDIVQDAPISRVDLVLLRNTLMYLDAPTQARVIGRLHFAVNPGGVLFLGKAEMLLGRSSLFAPLDLHRRFFRRVEDRGAATSRGWPGQPLDHRRREDVAARVRAAALASAPVAQVVLGPDDVVLATTPSAELLLGVGGRDLGRPFQDLELSYRPADLRTPLQRARAEGRATVVREVGWLRPGAEALWLDVDLVPLADEDGSSLGTAITFRDVSAAHALREDLEVANRRLGAAYEELQSTNEELETTNEELQSTVEELETTNEELQSTNEELETLNSELQSINEDLHSSNALTQARTRQVDALNAHMEAVMAGLPTGVVVVDRLLNVQLWSSRAEDLWGLRRDEVIGSPLLTLDIGLPLARLAPRLHDVLVGALPLPAATVLDAVDRRGRTVRVRTTVRPVTPDGGETVGAVIVMALEPMDGQPHPPIEAREQAADGVLGAQS